SKLPTMADRIHISHTYFLFRSLYIPSGSLLNRLLTYIRLSSSASNWRRISHCPL
ncbi:hypothetical protein EDC96DRAFT_441585, partial [Choanephora cucurbitarum]